MYIKYIIQQNQQQQKSEPTKALKKKQSKRKAIPCFFTEKLKFIKKHLTCKL